MTPEFTIEQAEKALELEILIRELYTGDFEGLDYEIFHCGGMDKFMQKHIWDKIVTTNN